MKNDSGGSAPRQQGAEEERMSPVWWLLIPLVIAFWLGYDDFINWTFPQHAAKAGLHGDSFGGLNALFSGLAFAGLIIALRMQSMELRLQREELKETRTELKRTATAQEHAERALAEQARSMAFTASISAAVASLEAVNRQIVEGNKQWEGCQTSLDAAQRRVAELETRLADPKSKLVSGIEAMVQTELSSEIKHVGLLHSRREEIDEKLEKLSKQRNDLEGYLLSVKVDDLWKPA